MKQATSALFLSLVVLPGLTLAAGQTSRLSVNNANEQLNSASYPRSISADGRYVAFHSAADSLVAGDTNGTDDVFVHDRQTGQTTRVSVNSAGAESNGASNYPSISADGRYVAFQSTATNLASADTNSVEDIFVHDRQTGETALISVNSAGRDSYGASTHPSISADGRYVAFQSNGFNLVDGDNNGVDDIFVHDRLTRQVTRVSVDSAGREANNASGNPDISADGRYVVFYSDASNLVDYDYYGFKDVFVHDRQRGQTTRVSEQYPGLEAEGASYISGDSSISANGRFVVFASDAGNLDDWDTNDKGDIFIRDVWTGATVRVSETSTGQDSNSYSYVASISPDGRYVAFESAATNLIAGDTNSVSDIFVSDWQTRQITRVNVDNAGLESNDSGHYPSISADGRYVVFGSKANNLVAGDTNSAFDVFVRDRLLLPNSQADVSLTLNGPSSAVQGSEALYTFIVTNNGNIEAKNATLTGIISGRGKLKSIVSSQGQCRSSAVPVCRLGVLSPGQSATVTAVVKVNGKTTLKATAQAAPKDNNPGNNERRILTTIQ